jgi:hypothetical protein
MSSYGKETVLLCGCLASRLQSRPPQLAAVLLVSSRIFCLGDLNLPPYGESAVLPPSPVGAGLASLLLAPLEVLSDAGRVPLFWVLFGTFFICEGPRRSLRPSGCQV